MLGADFNGRLLCVARDGELIGVGRIAAARAHHRHEPVDSSIAGHFPRATRHPFPRCPCGPAWLPAAAARNWASCCGRCARHAARCRVCRQRRDQRCLGTIARTEPGARPASALAGPEPGSSVGDAVELRRTARVPVGAPTCSSTGCAWRRRHWCSRRALIHCMTSATNCCCAPAWTILRPARSAMAMRSSSSTWMVATWS